MRFIRLLLPLMILAVVGQAKVTDETVKTAVMSLYDLDPIWFEVEVLTNQLADSDATSLSLEALTVTSGSPTGLISFVGSVQPSDNDAPVSGRIQVRIRKYAEAWILDQTVSRHQDVSTAALASSRVEVTNQTDRLLVPGDNLAGLRFARNAGKGQLLSARLVELIPDVVRGTEVAILIEEPGFTVSVPGVTIQDGAFGTVVKVRNKQSGRVIVGYLRDAQTVVLSGSRTGVMP